MKKLHIQPPDKNIDKDKFIENADFKTLRSSSKGLSKKPTKKTMDKRKKEVSFLIKQKFLEDLQNESKKLGLKFPEIIRLIIFDNNLKISIKKIHFYTGHPVRKSVLLTESEHNRLLKIEGSSYLSEKILEILKKKIEWID